MRKSARHNARRRPGQSVRRSQSRPAAPKEFPCREATLNPQFINQAAITQPEIQGNAVAGWQMADTLANRRSNIALQLANILNGAQGQAETGTLECARRDLTPRKHDRKAPNHIRQSQQCGCLAKVEPRAPRHERRRVAVADVAEKIRFHMSLREELLLAGLTFASPAYVPPVSLAANTASPGA